jgi:hypothetical protein
MNDVTTAAGIGLGQRGAAEALVAGGEVDLAVDEQVEAST